MKKLLFTTSIFIFSALVILSGVEVSFSQGLWTQKANLTGAARTNACGFSIGAKGYICCGFDGTNYLDDLWEFDPTGNSWTQKANIPLKREGAVAFTIGTKAYIGTGQDSVKLRDFWMWNQTNNTWTQKQNFLSTARSEAAGFSIGAKGYIGTGNDGTNRYDFYEYDTLTNVWTQKADFTQPGRNSCIGFSFNGMGYMGSGYKSGTVYTQIYQYSPSINAWTYIGIVNYSAYSMSACIVGNNVYFGTGIDDNSITYSKFSKWDPVNDTISLTPFGGTSRYNAVSFSIANNVYIGTGYDTWVTQDLWEYTIPPTSAPSTDFSSQVFLYPNPVVNNLQIYIDNGQNKNIELKIFNSSGEKVSYSKNGKMNMEINLSFLHSGVYYIKISSEEKTTVKRFVKM